MEKVKNEKVLQSNCNGIQMLVEVIRNHDFPVLIVRNPQGQPFYETQSFEDLAKLFRTAFDCLEVQGTDSSNS